MGYLYSGVPALDSLQYVCSVLLYERIADTVNKIQSILMCYLESGLVESLAETI